MFSLTISLHFRHSISVSSDPSLTLSSRLLVAVFILFLVSVCGEDTRRTQISDLFLLMQPLNN